MYLIINKTEKNTTTHEGDFPENLVEDLLKRNNDIIVISLYSNTIKVPVKIPDALSYRIGDYAWVDYPLPVEAIAADQQKILDDTVYYGYTGIDALYAIAVKKGTNYKEVVEKMRERINKVHSYFPLSSVMWEDIQEIDKEDFLAVNY